MDVDAAWIGNNFYQFVRSYERKKLMYSFIDDVVMIVFGYLLQYI